MSNNIIGVVKVRQLIERDLPILYGNKDVENLEDEFSDIYINRSIEKLFIKKGEKVKLSGDIRLNGQIHVQEGGELIISRANITYNSSDAFILAEGTILCKYTQILVLHSNNYFCNLISINGKGASGSEFFEVSIIGNDNLKVKQACINFRETGNIKLSFIHINNLGGIQFFNSWDVQIKSYSLEDGIHSGITIRGRQSNNLILEKVHIHIKEKAQDEGIKIVESSGVSIKGSYNSINTNNNNSGLYCRNVQNLQIEHLNIEQCKNDENGGGVYFENVYNCEIEQISVKNCEAGLGGGGYFENCKFIKITKYIIVEKCKAKDAGGGLYLNNSELRNIKVKNCSSSNNGGGIFLSHQSSLNRFSITNCSASGQGAGLYALESCIVENLKKLEGCKTSNSRKHGRDLCIKHSTKVILSKTFKGKLEIEKDENSSVIFT